MPSKAYLSTLSNVTSHTSLVRLTLRSNSQRLFSTSAMVRAGSKRVWCAMERLYDDNHHKPWYKKNPPRRVQSRQVHSLVFLFVGAKMEGGGVVINGVDRVGDQTTGDAVAVALVLLFQAEVAYKVAVDNVHGAWN